MTSRLFLLCLIASMTVANSPHPPKLTVVMVIDQLAYNYIRVLRPFLQNGIKMLLEGGTSYTNAFFPHANPGTAVGHTCLSTGTYARDHGIVANSWYAPDGKTEVNCDDDPSEQAAVYQQSEISQSQGKSAINIKVDGVSDQFMRVSQPDKPHHAFSISYKSRAAIATAGKLGKAIWFDEEDFRFTTSKAYFGSFPEWLEQFNMQYTSKHRSHTPWLPRYELPGPAYAMHDPQTYNCCKREKSPMNTPNNIGIHTAARSMHQKKKKHDFLLTPLANQLIFDLARVCISEHIEKNKSDRLLLWICPSSLDRLGHEFGPDSLEVIDMIYHLDKQIGDFIAQVHTQVGIDNSLFIFTADHGVSPFSALMHARGYVNTSEVDLRKLAEGINQQVKREFGITDVITGYNIPSFFFDAHKFRQQDEPTRKKIIRATIELLMMAPSIKKAWSYDKLERSQFMCDEISERFKRQLFPGRSGDIIVQTWPYSTLKDKANRGTHNTPYDHDTHVPLIIYHPGVFPVKEISQRTPMLQFAPTLAHLLDVQRPSASTANILPGIVNARARINSSDAEMPLDSVRGQENHAEALPAPYCLHG